VRNSALADWRDGIAPEHLDHDRGGTGSRLLDQCISDVQVVSCTQLGRVGRVRGRPQDVTDLGGFREGMQIRGSRSVAGGARSVSGGFGGRIFRGSVRVQRGGALQICSRSAVREDPRSFDGGTRSGILRVGGLEEGQDSLGTFRGVAGNSPQLIEGQLEVSCVNRHVNYSRPSQIDTEFSRAEHRVFIMLELASQRH
jgi:hypothetical protein